MFFYWQAPHDGSRCRRPVRLSAQQEEELSIHTGTRNYPQGKELAEKGVKEQEIIIIMGYEY
jgi:hypothetical protein